MLLPRPNKATQVWLEGAPAWEANLGRVPEAVAQAAARAVVAVAADAAIVVADAAVPAGVVRAFSGFAIRQAWNWGHSVVAGCLVRPLGRSPRRCRPWFGWPHPAHSHSASERP